MGVQIQWGKLNFKTNGKVIRGVKDFNASLAKKESDSKSKKQFTELETVSFTITTSLATGGNPLKDYNFLKTFIGLPVNGYKFKVNDGTGTKLVGWKGAKFILESVDLSGTQLDINGRMLAAEIKLSFVELNNPKIGKKKKVKNFRKQSKVKGTW